MSVPIVGKLAADASESKAGDYKKFYFRVGVKFYDATIKKTAWTNYAITLWAQGNQADFYRNTLKKGNLVHVSAEALAARINHNDGNPYPYIEGIKCHLVQVFELPPLDWKKPEGDAAEERPSNDSVSALPSPSIPMSFDDFDNDIPF